MNEAIKQMSGTLTKEQAITLAKSGWWKGLDSAVVARAQLNQALLCMDFGDFQKAMQEALGRPVWTHEFARADELRAELDGKAPTPDMLQIINKAIDLVGVDRVMVVRP